MTLIFNYPNKHGLYKVEALPSTALGHRQILMHGFQSTQKLIIYLKRSY